VATPYLKFELAIDPLPDEIGIWQKTFDDAAYYDANRPLVIDSKDNDSWHPLWDENSARVMPESKSYG
jgi:hypothetical protein